MKSGHPRSQSCGKAVWSQIEASPAGKRHYFLFMSLFTRRIYSLITFDSCFSICGVMDSSWWHLLPWFLMISVISSLEATPFTSKSQTNPKSLHLKLRPDIMFHLEWNLTLMKQPSPKELRECAQSLKNAGQEAFSNVFIMTLRTFNCKKQHRGCIKQRVCPA